MIRLWCATLVPALLATCAGCADVQTPRLTPSRSHRAASLQPSVTPPSTWCPAGLLCEASETLNGWRVPAGCAVTDRGKYAALCVISDVPLSRVTEFYRSRYPNRLTLRPPALEVLGHAAPFQTPPRLVAIADERHIRLRAMVGDKP